jgi:multidrug efflux pump subunit AcrB
MKTFTKELFRRKKLVIFLFLILFGYGIYGYFAIPKQEMPEIDTPYMITTIIAPSMSASDIEDEITDDIEKLILTYEDVTEVKSYIYDNYAIIMTTYSFQTKDTSELSFAINNKINDLSLSDNITDISYNNNFDDPHIIFALSSETLNETEIIHQAQEFKNELLLHDEIKTINIDSAFNKEVLIQLDNTLLTTYNLSILDIYNIIYANTLDIPLGSISTNTYTISISSDETIDDLSILENIIIIPEIPSIMSPVYLKDIATITLEDTSTKSYEFNDEKAVFLSVFFDSDIDFTTMGTTILETKDNFLEIAPSTLSIDELLFLPDYVNDQINDVFYSLLVAIVIVMIIVLIGIGFRNSLLIIITIPIIIFGTIGILYAFGFELHKLTIVGLIVAIGILVDNQIVITEGIKRNIDDGYEKIEAAKKAITDNFTPVLSSTLTTIAAFIVIVLLPGFLGEIVSSMPLTVIIAISLSFILAMTLSPIIATIFLKQSKLIKQESIHSKRIKTMIQKTLKYPSIWIILSILSLLGTAYVTYENKNIDLYPNDERSVLYIDFENENVTDYTQTISIKEQIIDIINEEDTVVNYASSIGGNLPHFHFSAKLINEQPFLGRIYVNYDLTEDQLLDYKQQLETNLETIDNAKITVNVLELSPPIAPVRIYIQSTDKELLNTFSNSLLEDIASNENIKTYNTTFNTKSIKYNINYDYTQMSNSYVTKAEIDTVIATNINGLDLNIYEYNDDIINVHLSNTVFTKEDILNLTVYSSILDMDIPLSNLISITEVNDYVIINTLNNKEVNIIDLYPTNNIDNIQLEQIIKDYVSSYNTENLTITYGGENDMFKEISSDLISASIIAIILIFIIMFIQFNNFIKPMIIFLTIPLSFTGSFLFLLLFNVPITATSLVGIVSLLGITVNTGILLVEYISRNQKLGVSLKEACINAVYLRFRPIILTSTTTILGLIPLLITGGNFFRPLAISFMGGLVTSTLITIFLVPSVYYLIYKNKKIVSHS